MMKNAKNYMDKIYNKNAQKELINSNKDKYNSEYIQK